ncbi:SDR family oxidoreductase [Litoribrevibacter euphylliae]|uniref:SDR family oxidoreductase n=1 Tax=Litoribrevibacter euphylliae TaxID=1834034 RepID=A0ABV7H7Z7_9GAMM
MSPSAFLSVQSELAGKHILITGTTGFLGKVVLEKLLRKVPDVYQITLLARSNARYKSVKERVKNEVLSSSVFDRLKQDMGPVFDEFVESKISVVEGELTRPGLGMIASDFQALANDIDLVINCAASVNFREALDNAIRINTLSVEHLVDLINAGNGVPMVQVSTCYVNGHNTGDIDEHVYPPKNDEISGFEDGSYHVRPLIERYMTECQKINISSSSKEEAEAAKIQLGVKEARKNGWNDTYTFTKWMGEQLLIQQLKGSGLTIVRPSIIESTVCDPVAGWLEGIKVADALIFAFARGKLSFFPGDDNGILDVIPADLVANSIILSAAEQLANPNNYRIYQCCSGRDNPIQLRDFINLVMEESHQNYLNYPKLFKAKPAAKFKTVSSFAFQSFMRGLQVAAFCRGIFQPKLRRKLTDKVAVSRELAKIYAFYTAPQYRFDNSQLKQLWRRFSVNDQEEYMVSAKCFEWKEYIGSIHINGLHTYVLEERAA